MSRYSSLFDTSLPILRQDQITYGALSEEITGPPPAVNAEALLQELSASMKRMETVHEDHLQYWSKLRDHDQEATNELKLLEEKFANTSIRSLRKFKTETTAEFFAAIC